MGFILTHMSTSWETRTRTRRAAAVLFSLYPWLLCLSPTSIFVSYDISVHSISSEQQVTSITKLFAYTHTLSLSLTHARTCTHTHTCTLTHTRTCSHSPISHIPWDIILLLSAGFSSFCRFSNSSFYLPIHSHFNKMLLVVIFSKKQKFKTAFAFNCKFFFDLKRVSIICAQEWVFESECVCVHVSLIERERVCVCVCVWERGRERQGETEHLRSKTGPSRCCPSDWKYTHIQKINNGRATKFCCLLNRYISLLSFFLSHHFNSLSLYFSSYSFHILTYAFYLPFSKFLFSFSSCSFCYFFFLNLSLLYLWSPPTTTAKTNLLLRI